MADKKKYRRARKDDVLMPHVADDTAAQAPAGELSDEEKRARDAVALLCRDLFGTNGGTATLVTTPPVTEQVGEEEPDGIVEEPEPQEEASLPAEDGTYDKQDGQEEEMLPVAEIMQEVAARERPGESGHDFRLLLDLEYEKELGDVIGFERIRTYHENNINGKKLQQACDTEYDKPDIDREAAINRDYKRAHTHCIVRLALSSLFFLLLLCYENASWMARLFGGPLDGTAYPVPYILIGMQLLLLDAALCYQPLWEGLRGILHFSPVDHSAHVGVLFIAFFYHALLIFVPHTQAPVLLLSPAALCLVLLTATELLNSYREEAAFAVISQRKQKYTVLPRVSVGSAQESARARLQTDVEKGETLYLRPFGFVRNYFKNTALHASRHRHLGAHFLLALGVGASLGLFALAGGAKTARVLGFISMTALLCAPVISAVLTSLPLFFSAVFCLKRDAAIIGESPLGTGNSGDTLVLPGNELFLSMERERFRLLELCDAHLVTVYLRALLEKIQSPLADSFGVDSDSRLSTAEVTISHIGDEGICAELSRRGCRIALGTAEYMSQRGMSVKSAAENAERPLYVAVDDRVCAVFYVRYVLSADVEPLFRDLHRAGLKVSVRSKDPCVREDVFVQLLGERAGKIRVLKPTASELDLRAERVDATVVALHSCKQLARTVLVCRRAGRVGVWGKLLQLFCAFGGAVLAGVLTYFDFLLPGALVMLWILFWCGIYTLLSYFYLRRPSEDI